MKHEKHIRLGGAWLLVGLLASAAPGWAVAAAAQQPAIPAPAAPKPAAAAPAAPKPATAAPAAQKPATPAPAAQKPASPAATPAPAAEKQPTQAPAGGEDLDEVMVQGESMYDPIVRAEDKFFKAYNAANKDDDFDTNCAMLPTSATSKIEQRFCMPVFFADATAEAMRLTLMCSEMAGRDEDGAVIKDEFGNVAQPGNCTEPVSPEVLFIARRDAYVDNMLDVVNGNPELKKLALEVERLHREREELRGKFEDIRKQQMAMQAEKNKDRPKIR